MRLIINADSTGRHSFENVYTFDINDETLTLWICDKPGKVPILYRRHEINISGCNDLSVIVDFRTGEK